MKRWLVGALLALLSLSALAEFPERPVRIIVPLPPGGSPDTIARTLSQSLQADWGQAVVVENRTGGSQNIGADAVAKSPPDGYTWLVSPENVFTSNPYLSKQTFDPFTDLAPVTQLARIHFLLVVHPSVPATNVQELISYAKANPGMLNFGSSGTGSPQQLGMVLLQQITGTQMSHVPYKGAAFAVGDLLPGRIQVWMGAANSLLPHIREGKIRLLAVAGSRRFGGLPDVPTVAEAGVPGFALDTWLGLFLPAKVPAKTSERIHAEVVKILNAPELKARFAAQGIDVETNQPAEMTRFIREENARWGKVIREAGIKGE